MPGPSQRTITVRLDGHPAVSLLRYRRSTESEIWEAALARPKGAPIIKSTRTTDLAEAKRIAVELFGLSPPIILARTFADAAQEAVRRLEKDLTTLAQQPQADRIDIKRKRAHISKIQNVLVPAFRDIPMDKLSHDHLRRFLKDYTVVRRLQPLTPRERRHVVNRTAKATLQSVKPRVSTVRNLNQSFQHVMEVARELGWIGPAVHLALSTRRVRERIFFPRTDPRPGFSDAEFAALWEYMSEDWENAAPQKGAREARILLRLCVALMVNSGIRPGELADVRWSQIDETEDSYLYMTLVDAETKTKVGRTCIIDEDPPIRDVLAATQAKLGINDPKSNAPILARMDGGVPGLDRIFQQTLIDAGVRRDLAERKDRTLYSLRHYHATRRILQGTDLLYLAEQMGTSIANLQAHYSKVTTLAVRAKLTGHRLRREKEEKLRPLFESMERFLFKQNMGAIDPPAVPDESDPRRRYALDVLREELANPTLNLKALRRPLLTYCSIQSYHRPVTLSFALDWFVDLLTHMPGIRKEFGLDRVEHREILRRLLADLEALRAEVEAEGGE